VTCSLSGSPPWHWAFIQSQTLKPAIHLRTPQESAGATLIRDATRSPEAGDDQDVKEIPKPKEHKPKKPPPNKEHKTKETQETQETSFLFEVQVPEHLYEKLGGKFHQLFWEEVHKRQWCLEQKDKDFAQKFLRECFAKSTSINSSNNVLWGERDFLTTLFQLIGILEDGKVVLVERLNFHAISWAFAVFKKVKDQAPGVLIKRVVEKLLGEQDLLKQGLLHLTQLWR